MIAICVDHETIQIANEKSWNQRKQHNSIFFDSEFTVIKSLLIFKNFVRILKSFIKDCYSTMLKQLLYNCQLLYQSLRYLLICFEFRYTNDFLIINIDETIFKNEQHMRNTFQIENYFVTMQNLANIVTRFLSFVSTFNDTFIWTRINLFKKELKILNDVRVKYLQIHNNIISFRQTFDRFIENIFVNVNWNNLLMIEKMIMTIFYIRIKITTSIFKIRISIFIFMI